MYKKILLFLIIIFLCSCGTNKKVPQGFSNISNNIYVDENNNEFIWVEVDELKRYDFNNQQYVELNQAIDRIFYGEERKESIIYNTQHNYDEFYNSVNKYKGFFISRYLISKDDTNNLISKKDYNPLTFITRDEALQLAQSFKTSNDLVATLPLSYAYDAIFIQNIENIEDLGRLSEWSSEFSSNSYYDYSEECVSRGTNYQDDIKDITKRKYNSIDASNDLTGFRILLYFK